MKINSNSILTIVKAIENLSDDEARESLELALLVRALARQQAPVPAAAPVPAQPEAVAPEAPKAAPAIPKAIERYLNPDLAAKSFHKSSQADRGELMRVMRRMYLNPKTKKGEILFERCLELCDKIPWLEVPAMLKAASEGKV